MVKSSITLALGLLFLFSLTGPLSADEITETNNSGSSCEFDDAHGIIAVGENTRITFKQYASVCAPVLWLSPDEPNLLGTSGKDIMVPMAIPSFGGMLIVIVTIFIVPVLYCAIKEL